MRLPAVALATAVSGRQWSACTNQDRDVLLPGDAEKQVEYQMLHENDSAFLHADVLKIGHHGSQNSTTPQFLSAAAPQISIISPGEEDPYGQGSNKAARKFTEQIWMKPLQLLTDGHSLQVSCFENCANRALNSSRAKTADQNQAGQQ